MLIDVRSALQSQSSSPISTSGHFSVGASSHKLRSFTPGTFLDKACIVKPPCSPAGKMASQVAQADSQERRPCTAPELLLKIVLTGTLGHFESRGMIDEKRLERMLQAGKNVLYKSHQESDVRYAEASFVCA